MSETVMTDKTLALGAGLDPVRAQLVYRAILDAFARPGSRQQLPSTHFPAALLPVLSLADLETGTHLIEGSGDGWGPILAVATGAPEVSVKSAKYVTALAPIASETVAQLATGTALTPEAGATLIIATQALDGGDAVYLTGPGVQEAIEFAPCCVDPAIWRVRADKVAAFPSGIDLLFVSPDGEVVGVPRTTAVAPTRAAAEANFATAGSANSTTAGSANFTTEKAV
ncbi:MAG: phosphonate C-P lyase system protein PhnH [Rhodococcus sp.]|nr:phosphonate C-P lyase system protein PhnH [Rhodococcus sp. (in: high G+C Gram-positive bacteria)]